MLLVRSLVALALLVVGAAGGLAAALVHESWWGLVLGLAAAALTTLALRGGSRVAFVLGWFGVIGYVVLPRAEGDYLIPSSLAGYSLLAGSFVLFLGTLVTLPRPGARPGGNGGDPGVSPPCT